LSAAIELADPSATLVMAAEWMIVDTPSSAPSQLVDEQMSPTATRAALEK
jgi:hypothetical protein